MDRKEELIKLAKEKRLIKGMTEIMNGGIRANILKIVKDNGGDLLKEDEEYMNKILALPKNEWISLDDDGNPISKKEADEELKTHLNKFKPIIDLSKYNKQKQIKDFSKFVAKNTKSF